MELKDLSILAKSIQDRYRREFKPEDCMLPPSFKSTYQKFNNNDQIEYFEYSLIVHSSSALDIYIPNQWIYIAYYFVEYYKMLKAYKETLSNLISKEDMNCKDDISKARALLSSYEGSDKEYLVKFLSDYSWWGGGKTIDRGDYYVSPILSLAGLVNASQSYIADICKNLAESEEAYNALDYSIQNGTFNPVIQKGIEEINQIIVRELKDSYTTNELANELAQMRNELGYAGIHLFALKYGQFIKNENLKELCISANIPESYTAELNKMRNLYSVIKDKKFGVCFLEDINTKIKEKGINKEGQSLQILNYLKAIRTKPFLLLAGISGTGKSRIVKQMAFDSCSNLPELRKDPTSPGNYCLIEVKPNWHDSTELLGYESKIGGDHYVLTPFVKFLAKAMLYPDVPFFVCLDEMNLAPVEQYFAEFLSVLESRTKIDGHIVSEPLIKASIFANSKYSQDLKHDIFNIGIRERKDDGVTLYDAELSENEENVYATLMKQGLRIPENVVVIGTVNMDETTHQFSRKVIDRAMTIEMNLPEGEDEMGNPINPFKDFFNNNSELAYRTEPTSASLYLASETRASDVINKLTKSNPEETERLKENVADILTSLNSALDGTPFKVAYRVQNELLLYFYQLWLENKEASWSEILTSSTDQILMMKVLPRIEGDEELLEKPLERLSVFCEPYPNASKKLKEMQTRLSQSRFTSFWP